MSDEPDDKPQPLVPADVDLRGLEYMPLLGAYLFGSDFNACCNDTEWRAGLTLWWAAWNQQPAGSLPKDEQALCMHAGFGRDVKAWRKVRTKAMRGFVECSDGRLYHAFLCKQVLVAWDKRMAERTKVEAENDRKRRERAERSRMFDQLRAVGVTAAWNIRSEDLRELVTLHVTGKSTASAQPVTPPVRVTGQDSHADCPPTVTPPVTPPVTAKTGRDGTGRLLKASTGGDAHSSSRIPDHEIDPEKPRASTKPSPSVMLAVALRRLGCEITPSHPLALQWAEQGVTEAVATRAMAIARDRPGKADGNIPPTYLAPIIIELRNPTSASARNPIEPEWQPPEVRNARA